MADKDRIVELDQKALELRGMIFRTICAGGGGHIPACLSLAEILTVLYEEVLHVDARRWNDPERDRFILSKGHAGVALYAQLCRRGFLSREELDSYGKDGTNLGGHPDRWKVNGVEASTGALGHGLGFGLGMALVGKMNRQEYRVFCLLGDGECQEGSVWEAAMSAAGRKLDNLVVIVDYNKLQALDWLDEIVPLEPLAKKWGSFGWSVRQVDGHDVEDLLEVLGGVPFEVGKPSCVVAHTIKGKGISYMENVPIWHYRLPDKEERVQAAVELGLDAETLQPCGGGVR
jgi:transketolase